MTKKKSHIIFCSWNRLKPYIEQIVGHDIKGVGNIGLEITLDNYCDHNKSVKIIKNDIKVTISKENGLNITICCPICREKLAFISINKNELDQHFELNN